MFRSVWNYLIFFPNTRINRQASTTVIDILRDEEDFRVILPSFENSFNLIFERIRSDILSLKYVSLLVLLIQIQIYFISGSFIAV